MDVVSRRPTVTMPAPRVCSRKLGLFMILNFTCCVYLYYNATDNTWKHVVPRLKSVYAEYDLSTKEDCNYECQLQVQRFRKDTLTRTCAGLGRHLPYNKRGLTFYDIRKLHLNHIYVIDDLKMMYCSVPKAGSSNWKRILLALSRTIPSVDAIHQYKVHGAISREVKLLGDFKFAEIIHRLKRYKKFIFVRNPRTRLLSAYRNKIERRKSPFLQEFGPRMKAPWFPNLWRRSYLYSVSFTEFSNYLGNKRNTLASGPEEHWREMYRLCEPCSVGYDFIGKMESVDRDAEFVLDNILNVTDRSKVFFMNASTNIHLTESSDERTIRKYYGTLPEDTLRGIYNRYKPDFEMFGYDFPRFLEPNYTRR